MGRYGYRAYRACLRWEFGFTCAFCLLHEVDFAPLGAEGLGITTIEHFVPAGADAKKANDYHNCFYACRLCNQSRSDAPVVDERGRTLLNPCRHPWGEHFRMEADGRLLPVEGDADGMYTEAVYDLNDNRKVDLRNLRRERLQEALAILQEGPDEIESLLGECDAALPARRASLLRTAERLRSLSWRAHLDVQRFAAVPRDADADCRCGHRRHHSLPVGLSEQNVEVPISARKIRGIDGTE